MEDIFLTTDIFNCICYLRFKLKGIKMEKFNSFLKIEKNVLNSLVIDYNEKINQKAKEELEWKDFTKENNYIPKMNAWQDFITGSHYHGEEYLTDSQIAQKEEFDSIMLICQNFNRKNHDKADENVNLKMKILKASTIYFSGELNKDSDIKEFLQQWDLMNEWRKNELDGRSTNIEHVDSSHSILLGTFAKRMELKPQDLLDKALNFIDEQKYEQREENTDTGLKF